MLVCAISCIVHAPALHTTWTRIVATIGGDTVGEDAGVRDDDDDDVERDFLRRMTGAGL